MCVGSQGRRFVMYACSRGMVSVIFCFSVEEGAIIARY